jgi:hypothetical protein
MIHGFLASRDWFKKTNKKFLMNQIYLFTDGKRGSFLILDNGKIYLWMGSVSETLKSNCLGITNTKNLEWNVTIYESGEKNDTYKV